jgi:hypothetical protein
VTVSGELNVQKNPDRKPRRLRDDAGETGAGADGGVKVSLNSRHAELVSPVVTYVPASIFQQKLSVCVAPWTLERKSPQVKQVQGDGFGGVICSKKS